ncbi:unnamed protein product [Protopolystoma xenopodis]|uniref:Uncharacterized protein n=1 Tax=Protopolystoma xenopodis TaxID=117903 RepID=A0A448WPB0_9PLAT|nr:unnamed protein product [Protopolystoma xenopodis]
MYVGGPSQSQRLETNQRTCIWLIHSMPRSRFRHQIGQSGADYTVGCETPMKNYQLMFQNVSLSNCQLNEFSPRFELPF